jgi:hypothetical protein
MESAFHLIGVVTLIVIAVMAVMKMDAHIKIALMDSSIVIMGDVYHYTGVAMVRMIAGTDQMNATVQVQGHQLLANRESSSVVLRSSAYRLLGGVMVKMIVLICLMRRTVRTRPVSPGNLSVRMITVYIVHGDVMEMTTVGISKHDQVQMRRIVLLFYDHQHNRHLCGQITPVTLGCSFALTNSVYQSGGSVMVSMTVVMVQMK